MSKVIKKALPIVGAVVGFAVLGPKYGTLIGGALGSALASTIKVKGKAPPANLDRLTANFVGSAPRKMVVGRTAMATDIRYAEPSGSNQEYVDYILHLASHRCAAVEELWIEDGATPAWTSTSGVASAFSGYLWVETILEAGAGAYHTVNGGTKWGAAQRLTGCCTMKIRIRKTGINSKASSPLPNGLPSNIRIVGKGMPLYDPRRDSTVPGGSGAHRIGDQSTWEFTSGGVEIGQNPALQDLAYHIGWRINGVVSVGLGIAPSMGDLPVFATSATVCDEAVTLAAGGTQRRYETAGVISDFDDPRAVTQAFADATNGWHDDSAGRLGFFVAVNDLAGALPVFTDDDILSGGMWKPFPATIFNIVRGRNPDPAYPGLYQPTDFPDVALTSVDGIDRVQPLDLPIVQDKRRAQRIAKQALQRLQYQGQIEFTLGVRAWQLNRGQVIKLSFSTLGWSLKLFRVVSMTFNADCTVDVVLREENAAIYAWAADERAAVQPAAPVVYDPRNNPLAGADGAGAFNLVNRGNMTLTPNSAVKTGGADGTFDASVVSVESFAGGAFFSARLVSATRTLGALNLIFGLNTDPLTDDSYLSLDYTLHPSSNGNWYAYENNVAVSLGRTWTIGDVFGGRYDDASATGGNASVTYTINGAVVRTVAAPPGLVLYLDSAFAQFGDAVDTIAFGPAGRSGADGSDGLSTVTQGSVDAATWHTGLSTGDIYLRVSNDSGATFGPAVRIKGETGAGGQNGTYWEYIFKRGTSAPSPPADNTGVVPSGWSDGVPGGTGLLYATKASFLGSVQLTSWTAVWRVEGADGAPGRSGADGSDGLSTVTQGSVDAATWHTGLSTGDIYLRVSNDSGATFGPAVRIKGETGAGGQNGTYWEYIFKRGTSAPSPPADNTGVVPSGWSDGVPGGTGLLYATKASFLGSVQLTSWTAVWRVEGADGAPGLTVAPIAAFSVACGAGGVPKSGQLPKTAALAVFSGPTDVTGSCTFAVASATDCGLSVSGSTLSLNSVSADTGGFTVSIAYGATTVTQPGTFSKSLDGVAGNSVSFSVTTSSWTSSYTVQGGPVDIAVPAGATVDLEWGAFLTISGAAGSAFAIIEYSSDGGSSWTTFGSGSGSATTSDPGELYVSGSIAASGSARTLKIRLQGKRTGGAGLYIAEFVPALAQAHA